MIPKFLLGAVGLSPLLIFASPLVSQTLSPDTVVVHLRYLADGQATWLEPVVTGTVDLYRKTDWVRQARDYSGRGQVVEYLAGYRYFIGRDTLNPIDLYNYKPLIRSLLPEAEYLHQKLGKKGFRFENLPQMLTYYNKQHEVGQRPVEPHWRNVAPLLLPK